MDLVHPTPVGALRIRGGEDGITAIEFTTDTPHQTDRDAPTAVERCRRQLDRYFAGDLREFDLPLRPEGTPFQRRVWDELARIPYGETRAYRDVARALGDPNAVRAVGLANGQNPLAIVLPCHRVVGADGTLTGYAGGLERKRWLLDHERRRLAEASPWGLKPDRRPARPKSGP